MQRPATTIATGEADDTEGESVLIGDDEPMNLLTEGNVRITQKQTESQKRKKTRSPSQKFSKTNQSSKVKAGSRKSPINLNMEKKLSQSSRINTDVAYQQNDLGDWINEGSNIQMIGSNRNDG